MSTRKKVRQVRLDDLHIDPRVQRVLKPTRIKKMAANFDPLKLGTIIVSERADGRLFVIDGQHRVATCKAVGYKGALTAVVLSGLTLEQEADSFLGHNDYSPVRSLDRLRAKVTAGDPDAQVIDKVLNLYGFSIREDEPGTRLVKAAAAVEKAYRMGGAEGLAATFRVIGNAWPASDNAAHGLIVLGITKFLTSRPAADESRLVNLLAGEVPMNFIGEIRTTKQTLHLRDHESAAEVVLLNLYNKNLRSGRLK